MKPTDEPGRSGLVFHPGHQELHGITVVVETTGGTVHVGRYDREDERGVHLKGVMSTEPAGAEALEEWLAKVRKFGVRPDAPYLSLPADQVREIRRLA